MTVYALTKSPLRSSPLGLLFSPPYQQNSPDSVQWKRSSSEENHVFILSGEYIEEWNLELSTPYNNSRHSQVWSKNLSSTCTSGSPIGLSISDDNDSFAFYDSTTWDSNGRTTVVHYKVSTDTTSTLDVSNPPLNFNDVHQLQLDKSGRYVHISVGQGGGFGVWDTVTSTVTKIDNDATDQGNGHRAIGNAQIFQTDGQQGCGDLLTRNLTTNPNTNWAFFFDVYNTYTGNCAENHVSAFATDDWVIHSRYGGSGPLYDEILIIWTGTIDHFLRLAHHRSTAYTYNAQPHAAVSFDGQYVMFNSDWETRSRTDVFILKIPIPPVPKNLRIK
jgi:hypothetical protein